MTISSGQLVIALHAADSGLRPLAFRAIPADSEDQLCIPALSADGKLVAIRVVPADTTGDVCFPALGAEGKAIAVKLDFEQCSALCTPGAANCDSGSSVNVTISDFINEEGYHFEYLNGSYAVPNVHVSDDWCIWEYEEDIDTDYDADCDDYNFKRVRVFVECGYHYDANYPGGFATKSWLVFAQHTPYTLQKFWMEDHWECWHEAQSMTSIILLPGYTGPGTIYHYAEVCLSYQDGHPAGIIDATTTEYYTAGSVVLS